MCDVNKSSIANNRKITKRAHKNKNHSNRLAIDSFTLNSEKCDAYKLAKVLGVCCWWSFSGFFSVALFGNSSVFRCHCEQLHNKIKSERKIELCLQK